MLGPRHLAAVQHASTPRVSVVSGAAEVTRLRPRNWPPLQAERRKGADDAWGMSSRASLCILEGGRRASGTLGWILYAPQQARKRNPMGCGARAATWRLEAGDGPILRRVVGDGMLLRAVRLDLGFSGMCGPARISSTGRCCPQSAGRQWAELFCFALPCS